MGCKVITLSNPRGLPRGFDLVDDFHVMRVTSVKPTESAPRGCITLIAREGGFRSINVDDIAEVVGKYGAVEARPTQAEASPRKRRRTIRRSKR